MQNQQSIPGICHDCDGYGVQPSSLSNPLTFTDMMSPDWECETCFGSGLNQSGDLCRYPVQSSDALGRDSTICYQCEKSVSYLFDDSRCKDCTRLTFEEVHGNLGQGDSISECFGLSVQSPDVFGQGSN